MGFDFEPTYRVSELNLEIREILGEAFRGIWVRGELQRPRPSRRGHLYMEVVEKGRGDEIVGKIDAVIWRSDYERIRRQLRSAGHQLTDGMEIRCFGGLDYYGPGGRLQFVVREVDPLFTLGRLELRRRETLKALTDAGLTELNRSLDLTPLPLRIGLVTSHESAAYHDFLTGLADSGYGFQVLFVHTGMQGSGAEKEIAGALDLLGRVQFQGEPLDAVVVTRGGGSRTDLATFDTRAVAEAVCRCERPVLCGLGHEIDQSIADQVCHTSVKTPTQAAELLVSRVADQDMYLQDVQAAILDAAERRLDEARRRMQRAEPAARMAGLRLRSYGQKLDEMSRRLERSGRRALDLVELKRRSLAENLAVAARRRLDRAAELPESVARRIATGASARLDRQTTRLDGLERLCHGLAPERILERGFSLTFDQHGKLVTDPDRIRSGDVLVTRLARGSLTSRVEDSEERES